MIAYARPDLETRTALSKSALNSFDACANKAWLDIHDRRPMILNEKIVFGSALDAGTEALIVGKREGWDREATFDAAGKAVSAVIMRDDIEVDHVEMALALGGFWSEVMPKFDWTGVATQPTLNADITGLGPCNGHPDIVLAGNEPWDVKSSGREKVIPSVELGFYAVLLEEAMGVNVERAGYLTWVRQKTPRWAIQPMEITPEVRRWTWENARRYAAARDLDAQLNADQTPTNVVFAGGPKFGCDTCQYAPKNGGSCAITFRGAGDGR